MKFANASNLDRNSGVAKWRDLLFSPSERTTAKENGTPPRFSPVCNHSYLSLSWICSGKGPTCLHHVVNF
jgi:hypothetical protein